MATAAPTPAIHSTSSELPHSFEELLGFLPFREALVVAQAHEGCALAVSCWQGREGQGCSVGVEQSPLSPLQVIFSRDHRVSCKRIAQTWKKGASSPCSSPHTAQTGVGGSLSNLQCESSHFGW